MADWIHQGAHLFHDFQLLLEQSFSELLRLIVRCARHLWLFDTRAGFRGCVHLSPLPGWNGFLDRGFAHWSCLKRVRSLIALIAALASVATSDATVPLKVRPRGLAIGVITVSVPKFIRQTLSPVFISVNSSTG